MENEPDELPAERVTIDRIVALNMRHWRREAGITQEELGRRLGWSAANVSAAERSADRARDPRRFDAQTLTDLSLALSVPLIALFLPPPGDGIDTRYTFTGPGGERDMGDLMGLVIMPDSDDDAPAMEAYRQRFRAAVGDYLDEDWETEVGSWLRDIEPAELRAERANRLRSLADAQEYSAAEFRLIADAIDPKGDQP